MCSRHSSPAGLRGSTGSLAGGERASASRAARAGWRPVYPAADPHPLSPAARLILLLTFLAFLLRLYRLGAQPIYGDEGLSVLHAREPVLDLFRRLTSALESHPPLFHLTLHVWLPLAGESEWAMRLLVLLFGVASVPLGYALGRRLLGAEAGIWGAALLAIAPFQVQFGQELRMYTMALAFGLLSSWALLRALAGEGGEAGPALAPLPGPGVGWWVLYGAACLAGIGTHYYSFFLLPSHGIFVAGLARRRRAVLARWVGTMAAVGIAYSPWALAAQGTTRTLTELDAWSWGPGLVVELVRDTLAAFTLGPAARLEGTAVLAVPWLALAALGLVALLRGAGRPRRAGWLLLLLLLAPALGVSLVPLTARKFDPRYLMVASPGYLLLVAAGLVEVRRRLRTATPLAAVAALAPAVLGLQALWFDPAFAKGDHPAVMRHLAEAGRPGDAVFVNSEWQYYTFLHYYARAGLSFDTYLLPIEQAKPKEVIGAEAAEIYPRYQRIWLLVYGLQPEDPESRLERYLDEHLAKAENTWYGPIRLVLYAVPPRALADQPQHPLDVHFADGIDLVGYSLSAESLAPGQTLSLSLFWRARAPVGRDYTVFTHLLDAQERVVAQKDNPPRDGAAPTSRWQVGAVLRDNYGLLVPANAAPGRYRLEIGLYLPASGDRLALLESGENRVILGAVAVREPE